MFGPAESIHRFLAEPALPFGRMRSGKECRFLAASWCIPEPANHSRNKHNGRLLRLRPLRPGAFGHIEARTRSNSRVPSEPDAWLDAIEAACFESRRVS
jgi:hypothetical protein